MTSDQRIGPISLPDTRARRIVEDLLEGSGVTLNGNQPWDIQVLHPDFFSRVLHQGTLGLGEAYMDGWWECDRIDQLAHKLLLHGLGERAHTTSERLMYRLQAGFFNLQSKTRAYIVGEAHYDLGNDLFERMLDPTMCYSCGYWKEASNLHEAQVAKLDLAARKLQIEPGMKVLDIGCGWGSFAEHAARHYGAEVTGITISKEQAALARERCKDLPVTIQLEDYRDLQGRFDRIVSIGMFEHVGHRNYRTYFDTVTRLLDDDGLFVLHTIGSNSSEISADPWINKYIFPNGILPSVKHIAQASEGRLLMEDWQNFGADYDRTLMAWLKNFDAHWHEIAANYNERTRRMFRYYLSVCAGAFRARDIQLWQVAYSKRRPGRYDAPR
ncbi:cyclopropane fatty acyl phospholipid synthase [Halomonas sp. McH1-25]|uniref:cyclopropane fatty acyl phospholipid synthase n=1 Tax=unclassified Halomonas TaxID=2609666 RepID=UPI001EF570B0|nr:MULTISPECIES: cyclopropane fatty acyl phospholipid synthase [unclassified Halomonas]MCG7600054.1 cyclopropane fatty acyl phospholipid synthase [Halomonas sp. McH1-25]MCP1344606.1 cyclopropane fatty acyl phospholipid synthase [Halomonas sp. FL8]MCP1363425.1 cyclopropane fatty acyl phospholipid synthase [Halomonas sp. BBD45]